MRTYAFLVHIFLLLTLSGCYEVAAAAPAQLALDLNRTGMGSSSEPQDLVAVGATLFFTADDGIHGRELWMSNGTPQSTKLAVDLLPGPRGSSPATLTPIGNALYFMALRQGQLQLLKLTVPQIQLHTIAAFQNATWIPSIASNGSTVYFNLCEPEHGCELWSASESSGNAKLIKDIQPGPESSFPSNLTVFNGRVIFAASDGVHGEELWASDGSEGGTVLLQDINPGAVSSYLHGFTPFGGFLFFTADDQSRYGMELWRTDGTAGGTSLFYDICSGNESSFPEDLTLFKGNLVFAASDTGGPARLWFITPALQLTSLPGKYGPEQLTPAGNLLFFVSSFQLWETDLTAQGTRMVDFDRYAPRDFIDILGAFQDKVVFLKGPVLKITNGTQAGTSTIAQLDSGYEESASATNRVYFTSAQQWPELDLYVTNGTPQGTGALGKTRADNGSSDPQNLIVYAGFLYFTGTDGNHTGLWRTNGTGSAQLVFEMRYPDRVLTAGGQLYFNDETALYSMKNGQPVTRVTPSTVQQVRYPRAVGNKVIFSGVTTSEGSELWITGPGGGSHMIKALVTGPVSGAGFPVAVANPLMYFLASSFPNRQVLWRTNGTAAGTIPLLDPGAHGSLAHFFIANGKLYFVMTLTDHSEIWSSDGTAAQTIKLGDVQLVGDAELIYPDFYFTPKYLSQGQQLWRFSITERTSSFVTNLAGYGPFPMFPLGKLLLFQNGDSFWRTDGTQAGSYALANINYAGCARTIGDTVYMDAITKAFGTELWTTNGTPEGTRLFADVHRGPYGSSPCNFTHFKSAVYFSADGAVYGRELWRILP